MRNIAVKNMFLFEYVFMFLFILFYFIYKMSYLLFYLNIMPFHLSCYKLCFLTILF